MSRRQTRKAPIVRNDEEVVREAEREKKKAKKNHDLSIESNANEYQQPMEAELVAWLKEEKVVDATPFLDKNGYCTLEVVRLLTEDKIKAFGFHPEGLELRFLQAFLRLTKPDTVSEINRHPAVVNMASEKPRRCDNCHQLGVVKHRNSVTGYHCRPCTSFLLCGDSRRHRAEAARIREEKKKIRKEQKEEEKKRRQGLKEQYHELLKVPHCPTYNEFQAEHLPTISAHLRHRLGVERFQQIESDVIHKLSSIWTQYRREVKLCTNLMAELKCELVGKHFDSEESKNAWIRKRRQELLIPQHNPDVAAVIANQVESEFEDLEPVVMQTPVLAPIT